MMDNKIIYGIAAVGSALAMYFGGKKVIEAYAQSNDPVISPVEAGLVSIENEDSDPSGSISSGGPVNGEGDFDNSSRVVIPLDETEEFSRKIGSGTVEVVFEAPELFVSTEDGQIVPTVRNEIITRNDGNGQTTSTVYVDQFGNTFNSQQELLDAAVKISDEVNSELQDGRALSLIEALMAGKPVNTTNFITERPVEFPEAKIDSEFQRRAQALGATLTADNPGANSAARIANFSRLAALGTDLSKVDIFGVQNPDFISSIKTGQGPLTQDQKQLLDQVRLSIDPRNMTSKDYEQIRKNQANRAAEKTALEKEVAALKASGLTLTAAKKILNQFGFAVTGPVTYELFATLNDRFGEVAPVSGTSLNQAEKFDAMKSIETAVTKVAGSASRSQQIDNLKNFLARTGRSNLDNLAPAELFALNRAGFSNVDPTGGVNQAAVNALKLLIVEVK
jgi:hypothetical protein